MRKEKDIFFTARADFVNYHVQQFENFHSKIRYPLNDALSFRWHVASFIKITSFQQIKLSITWFCCLEMLSQLKIIPTAFLGLTSTKTQFYSTDLKAVGRVLLETAEIHSVKHHETLDSTMKKNTSDGWNSRAQSRTCWLFKDTW